MTILKKFFCLVAAMISLPAFAGTSFTPGNNGFGISVGDLGGLTVFHKVGDQNFIQGYLSQSYILGGDYAFIIPNLIPSFPALSPYVGGGAFVFSTKYWSTYDEHGKKISGVGVKIPIGMLIQFPNVPIHLHAEVSPTSTVVPFVESFLSVQIGARFLF